ncbi:MAG TPA: YciI family protein [Gaiellaceae bacterium]|nr:YciI family protein [Gaiellaceae bacterium]
MRYLLLLYGEPVRPETLTPEQWQSVMEAHTTFHRELTEAGALVDTSPLAPPTEARTIRLRRGERMVVDGPFAETKEVLGGYYLIEAESLAAGVQWAGRLRHDADGSIEVRPLLQLGVDSGPARSS